MVEDGPKVLPPAQVLALVPLFSKLLVAPLKVAPSKEIFPLVTETLAPNVPPLKSAVLAVPLSIVRVPSLISPEVKVASPLTVKLSVFKSTTPEVRVKSFVTPRRPLTIISLLPSCVVVTPAKFDKTREGSLNVPA